MAQITASTETLRTNTSVELHEGQAVSESVEPKPSVVSVEELVIQDSILPPEIQVKGIPPSKPSEFKEILLTGGTGHLGVNFIPALQIQNPNLIIHCILRGNNSESATGRLIESLRLYSLLPKVNLGKIKILVGDLAKPNFGLPSETYKMLAESVDAIVHSAVKGNHVDEYNGFGEDNMRITNVIGTVNVLRFAATGKTKPILHASSFVAATTADEDGVLSEEFPADDDDGLSLKNGYGLCKFVCEKLMSQALKRGIPVIAFRYVCILGNSKTGYIRNQGDHTYRAFVTCLRLQIFPELWSGGYPIMPVDTAANISAKIFLQDSSELGIYNLTSASTITQEEVTQAFAKFGINVQFVSFTDWRELVFSESNFRKNELAPFSELYNDTSGKDSNPDIHPLIDRCSTLKINVLSSKVVRNYPQVASQIISTKIYFENLIQFCLRSGKI